MRTLLILAGLLCLVASSRVDAQSSTGSLEFTAKITPTAAKSEPVRDFTFYVLTKSYDEIVRDLEQREGPPSREKFIDELKVSAELIDWLRSEEHTSELKSLA